MTRIKATDKASCNKTNGPNAYSRASATTSNGGSKMDYIANIVGVSTNHLESIIAAALVALVFGLTLKYFWKFLLIGGAAVIVLAFAHEHMQQIAPAVAAATSAPAAAQPPTPAPVAVSETTPPVATATIPEAASDVDQAAPAPVSGLPKAEAEFLNKCVADGENSRQDCVNLWAEKQYVDQDDTARTPANKDAAASGAQDDTEQVRGNPLPSGGGRIARTPEASF